MPVLPTERDPAPNAIAGGGQSAVSRFFARPYWIGLGVMAMGAVWLWGALGLRQGARYSAIGPGLFVTIIGGGLIVLGLLLIIQIARGERFEPQDAEDAAANAPMDKLAFALAVLAAALPIVLMRPLGMPLTAALSFVLVCRAFGSRRLVLDIVTGLILCSVAWFLFTRLGLQLGRFFPPLGF